MDSAGGAGKVDEARLGRLRIFPGTHWVMPPTGAPPHWAQTRGA